MPVIGRLNGSGVLTIARRRLADVDYKITVFQADRGAVSAAGALVGDHIAMFKAFGAGRDAELTLQDGAVVQIEIAEYDLAGHAEFVCLSPVPGIVQGRF